MDVGQADGGTPGGEGLPAYFTHIRPELLEMVPRDARRILEIGCGAGMLGAAIKARQQARVVGIEYDARAAQAASSILDEVHQGDLNAFAFPWGRDSFDCVIAGDVLEHLIDPWMQLSSIKSMLARFGTLIVSIPNAAFPQVLLGLANGRFDYEDAGILDRTHLRFFTRSTFTEALEAAGFVVVQAEPVLPPLYYEIPEAVRQQGGTVSFGPISLQMRDFTHVRDIMAYQWLFLAVT